MRKTFCMHKNSDKPLVKIKNMLYIKLTAVHSPLSFFMYIFELLM